MIFPYMNAIHHKLAFVICCYLQSCTVAQNSTPVHAEIITFSSVYASKLIDLNFIAEEDIFLLISKKNMEFDNVMFSLAKWKFASKTSIMDSLRQYFEVYQVTHDFEQNAKSREILSRLKDYNSYKQGYLFELVDATRLTGPSIGFIIHHFSARSTIRFIIPNGKCEPYPGTCRATITDL
jgi:hypothetical protein